MIKSVCSVICPSCSLVDLEKNDLNLAKPVKAFPMFLTTNPNPAEKAAIVGKPSATISIILLVVGDILLTEFKIPAVHLETLVIIGKKSTASSISTA